ncbi:MAG: hypothetical protein BRC28_02665 [Nanohaloarchaea archaeon SW_4_43_9]|nr:MAG: hypothetical protein BRC28_02665 [Nanohaloarchaea archaeon SW_4_43_9]
MTNRGLIRDFEERESLSREVKIAGIIAVTSISVFSISYILGGSQVTRFLKDMTLATVAVVSLYVAWKKLRFGTTEKLEFRFTQGGSSKTVKIINTGNTRLFIKKVLYLAVEKEEKTYHVFKRRDYVDELIDSGKSIEVELEAEQENIVLESVEYESWNGETKSDSGPIMPTDTELFEIEIDEEKGQAVSDPIHFFLPLADYHELPGDIEVTEEDLAKVYHIPEINFEDVITEKDTLRN